MARTNGVLDLGKHKWRETRYRSWVSKTDLSQYRRCPYRVYLHQKDRIPYGDFLTESAKLRLIQPGLVMEGSALAEVGIAPIVEGITKEAPFVSGELVRNHELGIMGIPDVIDPSDASLIPIEVKDHSHVSDMDRLELAFYWRLLQPLRRGNPKPHGFVWLRNGSQELVPLDSETFFMLDLLIEGVREAKAGRRDLSVVDECSSCVFQRDHLNEVIRSRGLSLLHKIGQHRELALRGIGIQTLDQLVAVDASAIYAMLSRKGSSFGFSAVVQAQQHARAYLDNKPMTLADGAIPDMKRALILDLEYDARIFTVGVFLVENGKVQEELQYFAESRADERRILERFWQLCKTYPRFPIVTWTGTSADYPQLANAAAGRKLSRERLDELRDRHIDLKYCAERAVRLPWKGFDLSGISRHLGFAPEYPDVSGMDMPHLYAKFLGRNRSPGVG